MTKNIERVALKIKIVSEDNHRIYVNSTRDSIYKLDVITSVICDDKGADVDLEDFIDGKLVGRTILVRADIDRDDHAIFWRISGAGSTNSDLHSCRVRFHTDTFNELLAIPEGILVS